MVSQVCTKNFLKTPAHTPGTNRRDLPHSLLTSELNLQNYDLQQFGVMIECDLSS